MQLKAKQAEYEQIEQKLNVTWILCNYIRRTRLKGSRSHFSAVGLGIGKKPRLQPLRVTAAQIFRKFSSSELECFSGSGWQQTEQKVHRRQKPEKTCFIGFSEKIGRNSNLPKMAKNAQSRAPPNLTYIDSGNKFDAED